MILYIQICQLTFLRIIVLWALAVTALVLGGIIVTIFRPGFRLFRYCVTIVTVFYILLAFAKPDYWIARYNMQIVDFTAVSEEPAEDSYRDFYYPVSYTHLDVYKRQAFTYMNRRTGLYAAVRL